MLGAIAAAMTFVEKNYTKFIEKMFRKKNKIGQMQILETTSKIITEKEA